MIQQELLAIPRPYKQNRRLIVGYASTDTPGVDVPYLRIRGQWLQDAGFVIGRYVKIEVSPRRLMIEQVDWESINVEAPESGGGALQKLEQRRERCSEHEHYRVHPRAERDPPSSEEATVTLQFERVLDFVGDHFADTFA